MLTITLYIHQHGRLHFEIVEGRPTVPPILRMKADIFAAVDEYVRDINDAFQKVRDAIKAS